MSRLAAHASRWAPRMGASVADQGAGAVTHLVLHVALARLWEPAEYGMFALTFAVLLFLMGAHSAVVAEPMSILGPAQHGSTLRSYLRSTLRLHLMISGAVCATAILLGLVTAPWSSTLGMVLVGLALAIPGALTLILLRRACYVLDRAGVALLGSLVYSTVVLTGLFGLYRLGVLIPATALALLGAGGGVATLVVYWRLSLSRADPSDDLGAIWRENWHYGRWILAANLAHWGGTGVYLFFVGALAGLANAGVFRALQTLVSPAQQVLTALGLLVLPWLAGKRAGPRGEPVRVGQLVRLWGPVIGMIGGYGLVLSIWGPIITEIVYDNPDYTAAAGLLPVFALFIVIMAVAHGLTLSLRSAERSQPVFWSKLAGSVVAIVFGLALTWQGGLVGAAWGMTFSVLAETGVLLSAFYSWRNA